ncbi:MAG TPA: hypothetical protein PLP50_06800 [Thermoanaerobaculia bacterium]|nr:hypothetical protein [Thermoanaerobaculia bacterium]HPA51294.1 hypothetical protein [Thermoanaerobaculia bacterium]HQN06426.1 hypothetical protein [Thermoanaerobaculia bacterium]HQP86826.1 hypothetical protein [Thermoanaerobaculia bacterium]
MEPDTVHALRARRAVAALLVGTGLLTLSAGAVRHDLSWPDSLRMARRFWRAGPRGRLLNAPGIARDAGFAAEVIRADAIWPRDEDVVLTVGRELAPERRERVRRTTAYLLAPRRVLLEVGQGTELHLRPVSAKGPAR